MKRGSKLTTNVKNGQSNLAMASLRTGGSDPHISFSVGQPRPLSNTMLLGTTLVTLPNGISFHQTALAGARVGQMTYIQTDRVTDGQTTLR